MAAGFTMLLAKLAALAGWFGKLFVAVFTALYHLVTDVVCWGYDGMLGVAVSALDSVDLSALSNQTSSWGQIPADLVVAMGVLRIGEAAAIITAAIGIRVVLQLIPFTRLGS